MADPILIDVPANGIHAAMDNAKVTGFTTKTVAETLGVSTMTVTRWRKAGLVRPIPFHHGKVTVYVFSTDDIKVMREVQKHLRPGRRSKGDDSVRVTKPPKAVPTNNKAVARHALRQLRKDQIDAGKKVRTGHVRAGKEGT
jgi:hypothetical protein